MPDTTLQSDLPTPELTAEIAAPQPKRDFTTERAEILRNNGGKDTPKSVAILRESGAGIDAVLWYIGANNPHSWSLIKAAEYSNADIFNYMKSKGLFEGAKHEITSPQETPQNPWSLLYFYCKFSSNELKKFGYEGDLSSTKIARMGLDRRMMPTFQNR